MGFLVIDLYNDLWLGGQPDSSSGNFLYWVSLHIFLCFCGVSYVYCPHCWRLVKAAGLKEGVGSLKASNKNISSW